jgi:outer membrane murein-binding lipoprotein Lpp
MRARGAGDLDTATETEKALSVALIALAGAIFAGLLALWPSMLAGLSHNGLLYSSIDGILILALLGVSIVFGGRGYAYGPKRAGWMDRFNIQAVLGAIAIFLILILAGIIFLTTEPSPNDKFGAKQTELETRVMQLLTKVDGVSRDLSEIKTKLDAAEKSLGNLDRSSSAYSTKFNEIEAGIKSLSDRVLKLEKNSNQSNP